MARNTRANFCHSRRPWLNQGNIMDKTQLLQSVIDRLKQQLATMQNALQTSHEAATGSESKSESKYDTRGLDASYLADAQKEQCQRLSEIISTLNTFTPPPTQREPKAQLGSIVEIEHNTNIEHYFLLPSGGGITIEHEDHPITTLTPAAPLYQNILGKQPGDLIESYDLLILEII